MAMWRGRPRSASAPWSSLASRRGSPTTSPSPTAWSTASPRRRPMVTAHSWSEEYGLLDRWPVVAETFIQWVIEDEFPYGRPPYEDVGVLVTDDVRPYETLKLRILNAGHSTLTYMAALVGHTYIHEIMADPPARAIPCSGSTTTKRHHRCLRSPASTWATTSGRWLSASPTPRFETRSPACAWTASSKWPKFLVPTIESQLEHGGQVKLSALALAAWCQYLLGRDDAGADIAVSPDPRLDEARALRARFDRGPRRLPRLHRSLRPPAARGPAFRGSLLRRLGGPARSRDVSRARTGG